MVSSSERCMYLIGLLLGTGLTEGVEATLCLGKVCASPTNMMHCIYMELQSNHVQAPVCMGNTTTPLSWFQGYQQAGIAINLASWQP